MMFTHDTNSSSPLCPATSHPSSPSSPPKERQSSKPASKPVSGPHPSPPPSPSPPRSPRVSHPSPPDVCPQSLRRASFADERGEKLVKTHRYVSDFAGKSLSKVRTADERSERRRKRLKARWEKKKKKEKDAMAARDERLVTQQALQGTVRSLLVWVQDNIATVKDASTTPANLLTKRLKTYCAMLRNASNLFDAWFFFKFGIERVFALCVRCEGRLFHPDDASLITRRLEAVFGEELSFTSAIRDLIQKEDGGVVEPSFKDKIRPTFCSRVHALGSQRSEPPPTSTTPTPTTTTTTTTPTAATLSNTTTTTTPTSTTTTALTAAGATPTTTPPTATGLIAANTDTSNSDNNSNDGNNSNDRSDDSSGDEGEGFPNDVGESELGDTRHSWFQSTLVWLLKVKFQLGRGQYAQDGTTAQDRERYFVRVYADYVQPPPSLLTTPPQQQQQQQQRVATPIQYPPFEFVKLFFGLGSFPAPPCDEGTLFPLLKEDFDNSISIAVVVNVSSRGVCPGWVEVKEDKPFIQRTDVRAPGPLGNAMPIPVSRMFQTFLDETSDRPNMSREQGVIGFALELMSMEFDSVDPKRISAELEAIERPSQIGVGEVEADMYRSQNHAVTRKVPVFVGELMSMLETLLQLPTGPSLQLSTGPSLQKRLERAKHLMKLAWPMTDHGAVWNTAILGE